MDRTPDSVSFEKLADALVKREQRKQGCFCPTCWMERAHLHAELKRKQSELTCPERPTKLVDATEEELIQQAMSDMKEIALRGIAALPPATQPAPLQDKLRGKVNKRLEELKKHWGLNGW